MDQITESCVKDFLKSQEISENNEATNFENFTNFCIISKEYNGHFEIEDISTDKSTQGIDGIGIIVNGKLVDDVDEIDDLVELNKTIEVVFVLIQAKTSSKFESSEIGNFTFAVKQFFAPHSGFFQGPKMESFLNLREKIYNYAPKMRRNPICKLFYVTTGKWTDDKNLQTMIGQNRNELLDTNSFYEVLFEPCDANMIQKYYRKTKEKVSATFTFDKRVTLPEIEGIQEAYFGYIPFVEFERLIADEYGVIQSIFYDNIRDFLGDNPVNKKIADTLQEGKFNLFQVLNNGVTLVAESLKATGDKFTITDYQVVNGCQTSHVLFNNRGLEGIDRVAVPLRLIVTDNDDIRNEITKATNSQTEIKPDQLEALSEFQKTLERFYATVEGDGKLYYERRTNQYSNDDKVIKTKIVSIRVQIKAFSAMFLDYPHLVSGYYGTIAKKLGDKIFKSGHSFWPYYTSGLAYYRLEAFFRSKEIDSQYKKLRYHLLMLFRMLSNDKQLPPLNSKEIDSYCKQIVGILNDQSVCLVLFKIAIDSASKSGVDISDKYQLKQKEKTDLLKSIDPACKSASLIFIQH